MSVDNRLHTLIRHPEAAFRLLAEPEVAAPVIAMIDEAWATSLIVGLSRDLAEALLALLPPEKAEPLHSAVQAAEAVTAEWAARRTELGTPSSDLLRAGPSKRGTIGYRRDYAHGAIFWNARTGTGVLSGAIRNYHKGRGGIASRNGFPIGRETAAAKSPFGTTGSYQRFESTWDYHDPTVLGLACGATVYSSTEGIFTTKAGIGQYYEKTGGTWGPFGFPMSEELETPPADSGTSGYLQHFEGGTVYWSDATGVASVRGDTDVCHEENFAALGLPTGDEEPAATSPWGTTGSVQRFEGNPGERGSGAAIYTSPGRGTVIVSGPIGVYFEWRDGTGGLWGFPLAGAVTQSSKMPGMVEHTQSFEGGLLYWREGSDVIPMDGPILKLLDSNAAESDMIGFPLAPACPMNDSGDSIQFFSDGVVTVVSGIAELWVRPPD